MGSRGAGRCGATSASAPARCATRGGGEAVVDGARNVGEPRNCVRDWRGAQLVKSFRPRELCSELRHCVVVAIAPTAALRSLAMSKKNAAQERQVEGAALTEKARRAAGGEGRKHWANAAPGWRWKNRQSALARPSAADAERALAHAHAHLPPQSATDDRAGARHRGSWRRGRRAHRPRRRRRGRVAVCARAASRF